MGQPIIFANFPRKLQENEKRPFGNNILVANIMNMNWKKFTQNVSDQMIKLIIYSSCNLNYSVKITNLGQE